MQQITPISKETFAKAMFSLGDFAQEARERNAFYKGEKPKPYSQQNPEQDFSLPSSTPPLFAIGISGGADSMALVRLLNDYAKSIGTYILAFTVEHGLRPESANEAKQVHTWLTSLGIAHKTLFWQGKKPTTRIEETARFARYDLLINECKSIGIPYLCLAHNKRDNAETFLLRLAKASGVDGLSAIKPRSKRSGITLLRPLLDFSRTEIEATNLAFSQGWIEDPSNENDIFERVRWRKALPLLTELGLTEDMLVKAAKKQEKVSNFIKTLEQDFCSAHVTFNKLGFIRIDRLAFLSLKEELGLRVLKRLLMTEGANSESEYPPKSDSIKAMYNKIKTDSLGGGATLAGAKVMKKEKGRALHIIKEMRACAKPLPLKDATTLIPDILPYPNSSSNFSQFSSNDNSDIISFRWDRFIISFKGDISPDLIIDKLGEEKIPPISTFIKKNPAISSSALATIPVIKDKEGLLLIPLLGYKRENFKINFDCACTFNPFIKDCFDTYVK